MPLDLIDRLRERDHAVIVISHALDHVIDIADRAVVLRRGRKVGEEVPSRENQQRIVSLIVGGEGGAVDLAIGDLFGSILFNVNLLGVFDVLSFEHPLLLTVSPQHAVTGLTAILMAGIASVELIYRPKKKTMGWLSTGAFLLAFLYACNVLWQFLTGVRT